MADSELLRRIRDGSEEAFAELFGRLKGPLFRFVLQMTGSISIAEEITQEVFVLWIQGSCRYDERRGDLTAYLFGIARNRVRRYLRRRAGQIPTAWTEGRRGDSRDFPQEERILRSERLRLLRRAVLALPEKYREVVVLCDLQELSYEQTAAILGCRIGTVRSRLHRARELLSRKLTEDGRSVWRLNAVKEAP